jgi:acetyl-CoA C-acetyltransferase
MTFRDIFIVSAARTAIGTFGGTLKDVPLTELATLVVKAALERSGAPRDAIGHVAIGNVIPTDPRDAYLGRVAAMQAGLPQEVPAFNVNRLCGSGLQAIISAAQALMLGDCEVAVGAGAESMSRSPYFVPAMRWGARMGDAQVLDYMLQILHDPFHKIHMGITAENVAEAHGITRLQMDELARGKPPPRCRGDCRGPLQVADRPRAHHHPQGHGDVRHRRAREARHQRRNAREDEAGVQEGRRHGHCGQRLRHQ